MTVLITGGAGYVGSVTVPLLLARGHHVRVIDLADAKGIDALPQHPRLDLVVGDICDPATVRGVLGDITAIVHLAAVVGYPSCLREPERARRTNLGATQTLLECRSSHQRLIFASTGSVYGAVQDKVCTETTQLRPMTLYGETKAEAETLVRDAGNSVSFRYATAFGVSPCMRFDLLLNDFALQAVRDDALDVYEGGFRRTFIHVRDMARAIAFALERWDDFHRDVYNVGHESLNLTKAEVAERISRHVGCRLTLSDAGSDPDRRDYEVSYERLRATGFTTTVGLDDGILELVTAARSALDPNAEGPNGDG